MLDGAISAQRLAAHMQMLSDDVMEGRAPGTRGAELAARYIAAQFRAAGLDPAVGDSSFYQHVPLVGIRSTTSMFLKGNGRFWRLAPGDDFVAWSKRPLPSVNLRHQQLVFAGFGIDAPEYNWNDFKGLDVTGKVLVVLVNEPQSSTASFFDGDALTYYGRRTYKLEEAARRGASGVIFIHTSEMAGYSWQVVQAAGRKENLILDAADQPGKLAIEGWLTFEKAQALFAGVGLALDDLIARAHSSGFSPVELPLFATAAVQNQIRRFVSQNVLAKCTGSDADDKAECVIFSSHYDHLGQRADGTEDRIFNGAFDNASGIAALLEIARAFASSPVRPKRSVVFAAVTAEESGLLGSEYYTGSPVFPLSRTVADINLDGVNVWGKTADIIALGAERSTLLDVLSRVTRQMHISISPDPVPEQGLYFRSDHFSFAKAGIPAVFLMSGLHYVDRPEGWGLHVLTAYIRNTYHTVDDEFDPAWDMAGAVQLAQVALKTGLALANDPVRPVVLNRRSESN